MKKFLGILMIIAGIIFMWLLEGAHKDNQLQIALASNDMHSVDAATVDASKEGKLINVAGLVEGDADITDELGVHVSALRLHRVVETFQWTHDDKYKRKWVEEKVDDKNFDGEYKNKYVFNYESADFVSDGAHIGAYKFGGELLQNMDNHEAIKDTIDDEALWKLIQMAKELYGPSGKTVVGVGGEYNIFMGMGTPDEPLVGDVRVIYQVYDTCHASVTGKLSGDSIVRYVNDKGAEIYKLEVGVMSGEEFVEKLKYDDRLVTWCCRVLIFLLMLFGFKYCFEMLCTKRWFSSVVADYIMHGQQVVCGAIILMINVAIATFYSFMYDTVQAGVLLALLVLLIWKIKSQGSRNIRQDFRSCSVDDIDF